MANDTIVSAAYLHDTLEDSDITAEDLYLIGVDESVVKTVQLLTHSFGEDYFDYIRRVKSNSFARLVKIADIKHNLSDNPSFKQVEKYKKALKILEENK